MNAETRKDLEADLASRLDGETLRLANDTEPGWYLKLRDRWGNVHTVRVTDR